MVGVWVALAAGVGAEAELVNLVSRGARILVRRHRRRRRSRTSPILLAPTSIQLTISTSPNPPKAQNKAKNPPNQRTHHLVLYKRSIWLIPSLFCTGPRFLTFVFVEVFFSGARGTVLGFVPVAVPGLALVLINVLAHRGW